VSVGGKKDNYEFCFQDDDMEWWAEHRFNIREIRMLYSSLDHYQKLWPGKGFSTQRPEEEREFLNWYKSKLFSMITDYSFTHHVVDEDTTASGEET
tara:strand:+ start:334 stop:621 length:288 start_codon:yes stop_codon:yes gene_type:complete